MPTETRTVAPGPKAGTVRFSDGTVHRPPDGWELLPPGDAGLTRRVKNAGPSWTVVEKHKRRTFSKGVWAPADNIASSRRELETQRATPQYQRKRQADARRRDAAQDQYVEEFRRAVLDFLAFPPRHVAVAVAIAEAVTEHATPVGSGTVARTKRIGVDDRAEAAVIAWMRHKTTAYDDLSIPRVKGKRRQVRARLAAQSRRLLQKYRDGQEIDAGSCPIRLALDSSPVLSSNS